MSIANQRCIAGPFKSDTGTSTEREFWVVSVPAVDYVREAFFGALSLLGFPDSYNPESDQAAEYGSEIVASLTQIYPPTEIDIKPATIFPVLLKSMLAGENVDEVLVIVDSAFDAGSLTIGDAGDNARLMSAGSNSLFNAGQYQVSPEYIYPADTDVLVYLTGAPTTGSARIVLYSYREP